MMDFEQHKEDQKQLNKSLIIEKKENQDNIILEDSVDNLLKNDVKRKSTDNIIIPQENQEVEHIIINEEPLVQANINAGNNANVFVRKPVPHISRDLAKAMRKILKWQGKLSAEATQPVRTAINAVLHAHSESAFADALSELTEKAVDYIRQRPGRRFGFHNGNQRKADINDLLTQIAVFSAKSSSSVIFELEGRASGYSNRAEGEQHFVNSLENELRKKFGTRKKQDNEYWNLAEEDEVQMEEDIRRWGGSCDERARAILRERREQEQGIVPDIPCEFYMSPKNFIKYLSKVNIPDTKSLDDYKLLTTPGIESMRRTVYIPASQNLEKLIMTGQITDMKVIEQLRAKMETIRMQLDLYDARLKRMAGEPDPGDVNKNLVLDAQYLKDMERSNASGISEQLKAEETLQRYKTYQRSVNPARKVTDDELQQRRLVIEQNRARKKFVTDAFENAEDLKLKRSEEADISKRYIEYRREIDRLFNTDFTELFTTECTEAGMIHNCSRKYALAGMLSDLADFMQTVDDITPVERNRLLHDELLFTEAERLRINGYIELGKLFGPYYSKLKQYVDAQDEVSFIATSDYAAINQHPATEEEQKIFNAYTLWNELKPLMDNVGLKLNYQAAYLNSVNALPDEEKVARQRKKDLKAAFVSSKEAIETDKRNAESGAGLSNDEKKRMKALDKARNYAMHSEKDLDDMIKEDPATVATEFKEKRIRETTERVNKALEAYAALSTKEAKPGDEIKVRLSCVDTISTLSGIDQEAFEFIPTDVIVEQLRSIDQREIFDQGAFAVSTDAMLKNRFADGEGISDALVPLCKKNEKKRNLAESFKLKEYSYLAIKRLVPGNAVTREALENQDAALLAKISLSLSLVRDTKHSGKKSEKKIISAMATVLSLFTGEKKESYEFIPEEALTVIMNEAVKALGSGKDIPGYIKKEVTTEKNKKIIRDGVAPMERLDQAKATRADLDKCRAAFVNALSALAGMEKNSFDMVPLDRLYGLLLMCQDMADNSEEMTKLIKEGVESEDDNVTTEEFATVTRQLDADPDMSPEMKNYLLAEYGMRIYDKLLDDFNLSDGEEHTREDFANMDNDVFAKAMFMGVDVLNTGSEVTDENAISEYREKWLIGFLPAQA